MVALIPKAEIEALNIDTVERAIAFSALALRAAIVGRTEFDANEDRDVLIDIVANRDNTTSLAINALLPFDNYNFYTQGGLIIENIQSLSNAFLYLDNNQLDFTTEPSTESLPEIPDYNQTLVNTFERYLFYYSSILWASLENKRNKIVNFRFNPDGTIKLELAIPFDINKWLLGDNYINSVLRVVDSYQLLDDTTEETSNILSRLTNDQILNNDLLLTN
ncbi:MAG: hypothetical protein QNJ65_11840 [Xenococcaceae cyanobacterium MO_234.B1]|nr:hypothetical protein [Xenococcaceae cyanobacterium MO_234.B1]